MKEVAYFREQSLGMSTKPMNMIRDQTSIKEIENRRKEKLENNILCKWSFLTKTF